METCVIPLYSMEQRTGSWMKSVWSFWKVFRLKLVVYRILKLSKFHSQLSVRIGLSWPSITSRILKQKLSFLCRLLTSDDDSIATRTFNTFVSKNAYNLSLVKQCIFLDPKLKTNFTALILSDIGSSSASLKVMKKSIFSIHNTIKVRRKSDIQRQLTSCSERCLCWDQNVESSG